MQRKLNAILCLKSAPLNSSAFVFDVGMLITFHQDVYTGLTVLRVILVFGWVGEEIARKTLPRLQLMYTPRRSTQPLPRLSLLSKCPTCLRYALTCNDINKCNACSNETHGCLKALDGDLLCQI